MDKGCHQALVTTAGHGLGYVALSLKKVANIMLQKQNLQEVWKNLE